MKLSSLAAIVSISAVILGGLWYFHELEETATLAEYDKRIETEIRKPLRDVHKDSVINRLVRIRAIACNNGGEVPAYMRESWEELLTTFREQHKRDFNPGEC